MQVAVIGYGAVGRETAKILGERGDMAVLGQRRPPDDLGVGARFIATDVLDRESPIVCAETLESFRLSP
ncbi:hypothetical protein [Rhodoblastus sp.]|uniref:hypothetical protein n=1 Tax=Rhodoblastus sp. TaxID=1962975 RepID=UPI003F979EA6